MISQRLKAARDTHRLFILLSLVQFLILAQGSSTLLMFRTLSDIDRGWAEPFDDPRVKISFSDPADYLQHSLSREFLGALFKNKKAFNESRLVVDCGLEAFEQDSTTPLHTLTELEALSLTLTSTALSNTQDALLDKVLHSEAADYSLNPTDFFDKFLGQLNELLESLGAQIFQKEKLYVVGLTGGQTPQAVSLEKWWRRTADLLCSEMSMPESFLSKEAGVIVIVMPSAERTWSYGAFALKESARIREKFGQIEAQADTLWPILKDLNVGEALAVLAKEKKVGAVIFGIQLRFSRWLFTPIAIALASLMLLLLAHLQQIRMSLQKSSLLSSGGQAMRKELDEFAWVLLYQGDLSRLIAISSLYIPLISMFSFVNGAFPNRLVMPYFVLGFLMPVWILSCCYDIRRAVRPSGQDWPFVAAFLEFAESLAEPLLAAVAGIISYAWRRLWKKRPR